jgi:hypothetical protein
MICTRQHSAKNKKEQVQNHKQRDHRNLTASRSIKSKNAAASKATKMSVQQQHIPAPRTTKLRDCYYLSGEHQVSVCQQLMLHIPQFYEVVTQLVCEYWKPVLHIPCTLDVCDEQGTWRAANAVQKSGNYIAVHYVGFGCTYDDWININSIRLAPYATFTTSSALKLDSFLQQYPFTIYSTERNKHNLQWQWECCQQFLQSTAAPVSCREHRFALLHSIWSDCVRDLLLGATSSSNTTQLLQEEFSQLFRTKWCESVEASNSLYSHSPLARFTAYPERFTLKMSGKKLAKRQLNRMAAESAQKKWQKTE